MWELGEDARNREDALAGRQDAVNVGRARASANAARDEGRRPDLERIMNAGVRRTQDGSWKRGKERTESGQESRRRILGASKAVPVADERVWRLAVSVKSP